MEPQDSLPDLQERATSSITEDGNTYLSTGTTLSLGGCC
jgi:hypothetical protein